MQRRVLVYDLDLQQEISSYTFNTLDWEAVSLCIIQIHQTLELQGYSVIPTKCVSVWLGKHEDKRLAIIHHGEGQDYRWELAESSGTISLSPEEASVLQYRTRVAWDNFRIAYRGIREVENDFGKFEGLIEAINAQVLTKQEDKYLAVLILNTVKIAREPTEVGIAKELYHKLLQPKRISDA